MAREGIYRGIKRLSFGSLMGLLPPPLESSAMSQIFFNESDVELLRELVRWFLDSQDPELDDNIYDRNDEHLIRTILLPRIAAPFDPDGGTSKDRDLLRQVLRTVLEDGFLEGERERNARSVLDALAHGRRSGRQTLGGSRPDEPLANGDSAPR